MELGNCPKYNRPYEAYSVTNSVLVCPDCVMFGGHKSDDIIKPEQAVSLLREKFDTSIKQGKF